MYIAKTVIKISSYFHKFDRKISAHIRYYSTYNLFWIIYVSEINYKQLDACMYVYIYQEHNVQYFHFNLYSLNSSNGQQRKFLETNYK